MPDVMQVAVVIACVSTCVLVALIFYLFYKSKLSWIFLLASCMVGGLMQYNVLVYRRDALMLLMVFLVIYLYRRYITNSLHRVSTLTLLYVYGIITILTHEAAFFCFVPFFYSTIV